MIRTGSWLFDGASFDLFVLIAGLPAWRFVQLSVHERQSLVWEKIRKNVCLPKAKSPGEATAASDVYFTDVSHHGILAFLSVRGAETKHLGMQTFKIFSLLRRNSLWDGDSGVV